MHASHADALRAARQGRQHKTNEHTTNLISSLAYARYSCTDCLPPFLPAVAAAYCDFKGSCRTAPVKDDRKGRNIDRLSSISLPNTWRSYHRWCRSTSFNAGGMIGPLLGTEQGQFSDLYTITKTLILPRQAKDRQVDVMKPYCFAGFAASLCLPTQGFRGAAQINGTAPFLSCLSRAWLGSLPYERWLLKQTWLGFAGAIAACYGVLVLAYAKGCAPPSPPREQKKPGEAQNDEKDEGEDNEQTALVTADV